MISATNTKTIRVIVSITSCFLGNRELHEEYTWVIGLGTMQKELPQLNWWSITPSIITGIVSFPGYEV